MRSLRYSIPTLLILPACISAITLDCSHLRVDKQSFDFQKLGGPKAVHDVEWERPSIENNTYTIDICRPLKTDKNLDNDDQCPSGTWVCGQKWVSRKNVNPFVERAIPIAGEFLHDGRGMEPKLTRLKGSSQNSDNKEGVVVELHGGKYPNKKSGQAQKAIIEFLCDKDVSGLEGFGKDAKMADAAQYGAMERRADDDDDEDDTPDLPNLDKGKSLKFISYKSEDDVQVLRLRWRTKYACEGKRDEPDEEDGKKSGGWGFFTWFIIVFFLLVAAYIIFGSWLNYNRYGARGWDLIPHGDTIRDFPYVIRDWCSGAVDRVRGGDSRGGYSAV